MLTFEQGSQACALSLISCVFSSASYVLRCKLNAELPIVFYVCALQCYFTRVTARELAQIRSASCNV